MKSIKIEDYCLDTITGYLTPKPDSNIEGLTAQMKTIFIAAYSKSGNVTKAAKAAGTDRATVMKHMELDIQFYKDYQVAVDTICDEAEENLLKLSKHNPTACFGLLRAFRPRIWNDKKQIDIQGAPDKLKGLLDELKKEGKLIDVNKAQ